MLFHEVAVPRSGPGEPYVSWRVGDCEGIVLDRGPDGGHPADAEVARNVGDDLDQGPARDRPLRSRGPGLEL